LKWKTVVGFDNYEVSDLGQVRRVGSEALLKQSANNSGYLGFSPCRDGRGFTRAIHRTVAEAFIGPIPPGMDVNHINFDKTDNRLENLEITSRSENIKHSHARGDRRPSSLRGQRVPNAILSEDRVARIRERLALGHRQTDIAADFGVCRQVICGIAHGKGWKWVM
jgi:hypothetical protein